MTLPYLHVGISALTISLGPGSCVFLVLHGSVGGSTFAFHHTFTDCSSSSIDMHLLLPRTTRAIGWGQAGRPARPLQPGHDPWLAVHARPPRWPEWLACAVLVPPP